jgi:hypothetical protein
MSSQEALHGGATTTSNELKRGIRNFSLEDVHVEGTERIVEAVAKYDVDRYIHVSSHNADSKSGSEFFATKVSAIADISINGRRF